MAVTEVIMGPGSWSITLSPDTPRTIIDALQYFQHIVVSTGRHNPALEGSSLFTSGRYTGVITGIDFQSLKSGRGPVISGEGLAGWLGNASGVGPVIEGSNAPSSANGAVFTSAAYATVINTLRPSSIAAGTVYPMPTSATYTGAFVWQLPLKALTSFAQQVSQGQLPTQVAEWRVNNNATLDFGPVASLYRTTPSIIIAPKDPGVDMSLRGLDGTAELIEDVKDYTTRVVVLASGQGTSTAVGVANLADIGATNPYTDFFGNPVKMTRMVSASSVSSLNATASAQAALLPYSTPADQVRLSSSEYDIKGDLVVGDYVYLYDPDAGFVDTTYETVFRGQRINPTRQRVIQADWPITSDMTVAYRDQNGTWYDLTDYVVFENGGTTNLIVGGYNRNLVSTSEPVGTRPIPDTTTPGVPAFGTFFSQVYQSGSDGRTRAQIQVTWSTPTNTDGTTLTDLDHYEIRYRPDLNSYGQNPSYASLHTAGYTYQQLKLQGGTYKQLIPQSVLDWKPTFVAAGINQILIQELTPGVLYDFQIRAVDSAAPPNQGSWSATTSFRAVGDLIAPPTPDAPTVASNMASVQVTWDLGTSAGGTFNQASDLHHVEVHGSYDPLFTPSNATKLGNLPANIGNITGQIPVVGSFTIPPGQPPAQQMYVKLIAVDESGNKSNPSAPAGSTATLWSNSYITDLSVSKLTAGTVTASIILAGTIATAPSGARVQMDSTGVHSFDANGNMGFDLNANSIALTLAQTVGGGKIVLSAPPNTYPLLQFFDTAGTNSGFINAGNIDGNTAGLGVNGGAYTTGGNSYYHRLLLWGNSGGILQTVNPAQAPAGGNFTVNVGNARFGVQNPTEVGAYNIDSTGLHTAYGTYESLGFGTNYDALLPFFTNVAGGFTGLSLTFGATLLSQPSVAATIYDSHATNTYATVTSITTTGMTITYPNANSVRVMGWIFRV